MNLAIHILSAEQAMPLKPFILPEVWEDAERDQFWYFAAMDEGALIGAAVVDPIKTGAALRSIAVSPDYARQGVAVTLLDRVIKGLTRADIDTLWMTHVLPEEAWKGMDGLMKAGGFLLEDEDPIYDASLSKLMESPLLSAPYTSDHVVSLAEASDLDRHHLLYALQEKMKIDYSVLQECDPFHSFIWKNAEEVTAAIFISPLKEDKLDLLWLWLDAEAHNPKALMAILATALQHCVASYPLETVMQFTCLVENSEQIVQHFVPGIKPTMSLRTYVASAVQG